MARSRLSFPDTSNVRRGIAAALREDLEERGDITSNAIFSAKTHIEAEIIAREPATLCGGPVVALVYGQLDGAVRVELHASDGSRVQPGDVVLRVSGPARALLAGERTALNFIQRLSGIATITSSFVNAAGSRMLVCDTRKTNPTWRDLDRYAVRCGGGTNHRFGLFDMVMIKDTHVDACGSLEAALERVRPLRPGVPVAAEARDLEEVRAALAEDVDLIMLDNMNNDAIASAVELVAGRIPIEVTGGITLERLPLLASLGVNRVSVGALTHSARAIDFSMKTVISSGASSTPLSSGNR